MKALNFRVLMIGGSYVDVDRLSEGIYNTSKPTLFHDNITKADIVDMYKNISKFTSYTESDISEVEKNLKDCVMTNVELRIMTPVIEK